MPRVVGAGDHRRQHADARTLITLLHQRDSTERDGPRMPIVSEMLDDRNRELEFVSIAGDRLIVPPKS